MGVGRGLGEVRHWMGNQPRISCFIGLYFYFFQCLTKLGLQSTPCPILAKTKTKRCLLLPSERCIKQTFFSSLLFVSLHVLRYSPRRLFGYLFEYLYRKCALELI